MSAALIQYQLCGNLAVEPTGFLKTAVGAIVE